MQGPTGQSRTPEQKASSMARSALLSSKQHTSAFIAVVTIPFLLLPAFVNCFGTAVAGCGSRTIPLLRTGTFASIGRTRQYPQLIEGLCATQGNGGEDDDVPLVPSEDDVAASDGAGASEDEDDDDDDDFLVIATKIPTKDSPSWQLGNSFDQFLNQCSIQSFMFLLKTCRDPQTVLWIESFTQPVIDTSTVVRPANATVPTGGSGNSKLLSYHGLAAMNTTAFPTWNSYFRELLEQPQELYLIESWQAHIPSYEMEIKPASLCTRMISVREQIAREFIRDLTVLSNMGGQTLQTYWQGIRDSGVAADPLRSGAAGSLLFLEADPNDDSDYAPSPLRNGNFDLLVLLATQESIHRVLNSNSGTGSDASGANNNESDAKQVNEPMSRNNRQFLSNFYLNRLISHFTGRQQYGRADQFLQELLLSTPILVQSSADDVQKGDDASSSLVDPTWIAEQILKVRQQVAIDWAQQAASVPELHMEIKRLQLDLLLKSYEKNDDAFQ
jgi:hypothetical protein